MSIVKYDIKMRVQILELSLQGLTVVEIAKALGVARSTLNRWLYRDARLFEQVKANRLIGIGEVVETNLIKLAQGFERVEITKEYQETDENERSIRTKIRTIYNPPCAKSLEILARKYNKELSSKDNIEITNNRLTVNTKNMTLREVQDMLKSGREELSE